MEEIVLLEHSSCIDSMHWDVASRPSAMRSANFLKECHAMLQMVPVRSLPLLGGVAFQADTDNRSNFPSERSFQLFKKQR